jgi:hypothetical protein
LALGDNVLCKKGHRTDFITKANWVDILLIWYVLVDTAYQELEKAHGAWRQRGPAPVFTDSEVITVAMFIDTFFHGHEAFGLAFLRQYHRELFLALPRMVISMSAGRCWGR